MHALRLLVAVAALIAPSTVSAQQVKLQLQGGRVSLDVRNTPLSQILNEWARVGGVKIVNGDKIQAPPVSLQLTDVPERQALDLLLRNAPGYILGVRAGAGGSTTYDRILILATTSAPRTPAPAAGQPPSMPTPRFIAPQADTGPDDAPDAPVALGGLRRFNPPVVRPPVTGAASTEPPQEAATPPTTTPANPFGVPVGSGLPGAITPLPAPQPQQAPARR